MSDRSQPWSSISESSKTLAKSRYTTRLQPITIASEHDNEGRLIMIGDHLSGVLVRLDSLHEEDHGRWFLEAGFGRLADATGNTFDSLEAAAEQIERLLEPA